MSQEMRRSLGGRIQNGICRSPDKVSVNKKKKSFFSPLTINLSHTRQNSSNLARSLAQHSNRQQLNYSVSVHINVIVFPTKIIQMTHILNWFLVALFKAID